ncbi:dTMP kinase [Vagococcus coleopterorum]|uniref:Thymidylate kinase n=1 Tax=Vagococcus coleopterorum TaxID=2714946 RepID=A0A6G8AN53_9ENTE|nr:dTMP kinase [Vagococcus coleopterorum]QIL46355.1 dTMP kinase [Vagococcus coleopterorum]
MSGLFITIEGPDGAGKTSLIKGLAPLLEASLKTELLLTREPGGIPISEKIREIILDPAHTTMDDRTEALLYAAARRQHLVEKVMPALAAGKIVLCDRFVDSSLAYQGAGRGIGMSEVASINEFACAGLEPDLTLYIDVDSEVGLARIQKGRAAEDLDRLDTESLSFHQKVRDGYLRLVKDNPERIVSIDGEQSIEAVQTACFDVIQKRFPKVFN